jgi:hypothetical protein
MDEKKLYRITFSKSLADKLADQTNKQVKRVELVLGDEPNEETKLYAICKKKGGWPLRVTLFKEAAEMWTSNTTEVKSCKIKVLD